MENTDPKFIDRLLKVIEKEIVPITRENTKKGSKLFGGAVLRKEDLSTVLAASNEEAINPLYHGEINTIKKFYEMPRSQRPAAKDCIFLTTHEPCPLCLSGITWGGFDNFYTLFTYQDSRDDYGIPHDLNILKEVFKQDAGGYAHENYYWKCYYIRDLINACDDEEAKKGFLERVENLKSVYAEVSDNYQKTKSTLDMEIPLP